jgi:hypothetical protein
MAPDGVATPEADLVRVPRGRQVPSTRPGFLMRLGRKSWLLLHGLADRWPCRRCRPSLSVWMSGAHDAVNVRIGRPPFRPEAWEKFRDGSLEGGYHQRCFACRIARVGVRLFASPRPDRR